MPWVIIQIRRETGPIRCVSRNRERDARNAIVLRSTSDWSFQPPFDERPRSPVTPL